MLYGVVLAIIHTPTGNGVLVGKPLNVYGAGGKPKIPENRRTRPCCPVSLGLGHRRGDKIGAGEIEGTRRGELIAQFGTPPHGKGIPVHFVVRGKALIAQVAIVYVKPYLAVIGSPGHIDGGIGNHPCAEEFLYAVIGLPGVAGSLKFRKGCLDGGCGGRIWVEQGPLVVYRSRIPPTGSPLASETWAPVGEKPAKSLVETVAIFIGIVRQGRYLIKKK